MVFAFRLTKIKKKFFIFFFLFSDWVQSCIINEKGKEIFWKSMIMMDTETGKKMCFC